MSFSTARLGAKPNSFAEATLTFDNASRLLPLDMAEVQIGRRIRHNGDSEYLINRSAARLKDVKDLFLGTGAGSAAYSIIEQGRSIRSCKRIPRTGGPCSRKRPA